MLRTDPLHAMSERPEPGAGGYRTLTGPACVICNAPLTVHQRVRGKTCDQRSCRDKALRERLQRELEREQAVQAEAEERRQNYLELSAKKSSDLPVLGIVPDNDLPVVTNSAKRIRRFRDRLMQIISQAAEVRAGGRPTPQSTELTFDSEKSPPQPNQEEVKLLGNACATCRGNCCPQGGEHAFIYVDTILEQMRNHPQRRPRQILEEYLSRLPTKVFRNSCVYHTTRGCALPREMRSHICNSYLCDGLNKLLTQLREHPGASAYVASSDGNVVQRAAVVDSTRQQIVYEREPEETRS